MKDHQDRHADRDLKVGRNSIKNSLIYSTKIFLPCLKEDLHHWIRGRSKKFRVEFDKR